MVGEKERRRKMAYKYTVEVTGDYAYMHTTPKATMAGMLRYNGGRLEEIISDEPMEDIKSRRKFRAIVVLGEYTPERWKSFGLKTRLISKEKGKGQLVEPEFPDIESVYDFIHNKDSGRYKS